MEFEKTGEPPLPQEPGVQEPLVYERGETEQHYQKVGSEHENDKTNDTQSTVNDYPDFTATISGQQRAFKRIGPNIFETDEEGRILKHIGRFPAIRRRGISFH